MINIAEILKDCPRGTKLYSPIFGEVFFDCFGAYSCIIVKLTENGKHLESFFPDGRYKPNGECMLFPSKENKAWSTFQRPFKDGDILTTLLGDIYIYKEISTSNYGGSFVSIGYNNEFRPHYEVFYCLDCTRFATEEEKQKLFDAIKENGYKWNAETKTLENLIEPKFKVGDKIQHKSTILTIIEVETNKYIVEDYSNNFGMLCFSTQDNWELVPNKFDISTLKPFDKVLVRISNSDIWECEIFSSYDPNCSNPFHCTARWTKQCIPFEGNEHLLGTSNDCNEYYKTW